MRYLITIAFVWGLSIGLRSQTIFEPGLGLNYTWVTYDRGAGNQYRPAYRPAISLGFDFYLATKWSFNPKVMYNVKGVFVRNGVTSTLNRSIWQNYLSVPIEFRYTLKTGFKIIGGMNTGYWLSQNSISRSPSGNASRARLDFNDPAFTSFGKYNRVDLAVRLGILVESGLAKGKLLWSITYNHGFVPLYQPFNPQGNYHYDYNRWFQLMLIYPFKF